MNEKEISEIRRRLRPEKHNISHIYGCYVNEKKEVISVFDESVSLMPQDEAETYLSLLKRTLSGTLNKNLLDVSFRTAQVADSEEHRLLMDLKKSGLKDETALQAFYQRVIEALSFEGNYLILVACDSYDVPYRGKDDAGMADASSEMFTYLLCGICPVKLGKAALSYSISKNEFHNREGGWLVAAPELGFMFPTFDDRSTNIYNALYYTKDTAESHTEFTDAIFKVELPPPAEVQKETFQSVLADTLAEECSLEVVQAVHEQLTERIEEHKANKDAVPMAFSKREMTEVLENCGVTSEHIAAFEERFDTEFGADIELSPKNIIDNRQFQLRTPDVIIKVSPERSDLIETRVINGTKYILICANEGVEVNGVNIHI